MGEGKKIGKSLKTFFKEKGNTLALGVKQMRSIICLTHFFKEELMLNQELKGEFHTLVESINPPMQGEKFNSAL